MTERGKERERYMKIVTGRKRESKRERRERYNDREGKRGRDR